MTYLAALVAVLSAADTDPSSRSPKLNFVASSDELVGQHCGKGLRLRQAVEDGMTDFFC